MGSANSSLSSQNAQNARDGGLTLLIGDGSLEMSCCSRGKDLQDEKNSDDLQNRSGFPPRKFYNDSPLIMEHETAETSSIQSKKKLKRSSGLNTEPQPLRNWTQSQQKVLIDSLSLHPQARDNPEYRRKLAMRTQTHLPNKSVDEIEECYKHLQAARIAHFLAISPAKKAGKGQMFRT